MLTAFEGLACNDFLEDSSVLHSPSTVQALLFVISGRQACQQAIASLEIDRLDRLGCTCSKSAMFDHLFCQALLA